MINFFYISKKYLKWAGYLDIVCIICWAAMIFLISLTKVFIFHTDSGKSILEVIGEKTVVDLIFMKISVYSIFILLFCTSIVCFSFKNLLGLFTLCFFIRAKSLKHVFASVAVLFFPLLGGILAINTYHATVSALAPKYVASNSLIRSKFRKILLAITKEDEY